MAIKNAKDTITKNDIIDILKQNVTLYKNEPVFVEYIVNLALYLIDQACAGDENQDHIIEELISTQDKMRQAVQAKEAAKPQESPKAQQPQPESYNYDSQDWEDDDPPTNKLRLQKYDAVFKHPPTPGLDDDSIDESIDEPLVQRIPTPTPEDVAQPAAMAEEDELGEDSLDDIISQEDPDFDLPKAKQLRSVGILTPEPAEGGLEKGPKILIDQTGRTRVYKVVRSYNTTREDDGNCPICGTYAGSSARCPSCGHIL